jgi:hypothetical protein
MRLPVYLRLDSLSHISYPNQRPPGELHIAFYSGAKLHLPLKEFKKGIKETESEIHKAIEEGVDVRGYFYWSLTDNFDWEKGSAPRFGLVEIDYGTMQRIVRSSARVYAEICKNNYLD